MLVGFKVRKRIKIAPGVRVNLGSKSGSLSVGGHGVNYNTKLYGKRSKKAKPAPRWVGKVCFWVFIGWWWWPIRLLCYDLPKLIVKKIIAAVKKPEA